MPEASPARPSRRMPRPRVALAALACAFLLGTTACSSADAGEPDASPGSPSAAATDEPIFASDEEALAAAVEAYEAYAETSEAIASDGGADPSRIEQVVGEELAPIFVEEFKALGESGLRVEGATKIFNPKLVERSESNGRAAVAAYFCRDVTDVRILNQQGSDVTPDGPVVSAVLARFISSAEGSDALIMEDSELWDEDSFCV